MDEDLAANAQRLGQLLRSQLQAINSPRIKQARPWVLSATATTRPIMCEDWGLFCSLSLVRMSKTCCYRKR